MVMFGNGEIGTACLKTPFGPATVLTRNRKVQRIILGEIDGSLKNLNLSLTRERVGGRSELKAPSDTLAQEVARALEAWLAGKGTWPTGFPLAPAATPFQQRVRAALIAIAPGCRMTYGELARFLGSSARAVGGACRANPIPLLVPCHRVVAACGVGGYAGAVDGPRLEFKRWLLAHERR